MDKIKSGQIFCGLFTLMAFSYEALTVGAEMMKGNNNNRNVHVDVGHCFEAYAIRTVNATTTYAQSYVECLSLRDSRAQAQAQDSWAREPNPNRQQLLEGTQRFCGNLQNCNQMERDEDFLQCESLAVVNNMRTLFAIQLNATEALVALNSDYDETEKATLICSIEAKRTHMSAFADAYIELIACLG